VRQRKKKCTLPSNPHAGMDAEKADAAFRIALPAAAQPAGCARCPPPRHYCCKGGREPRLYSVSVVMPNSSPTRRPRCS